MIGKLTFIIATISGLLLSAYSLAHHLIVKTAGTSDAFCNINDKISCDRIALSSFSEIAGVPLGVFGIGYFICTLIIWYRTQKAGEFSPQRRFSTLCVVGAALLASAVLLYISIGIIKAACIVCIGVYLSILLQFAATVLGHWELRPFFAPSMQLPRAGFLAMTSIAISVGTFYFSKTLVVKELVRRDEERAEKLGIDQLLEAPSALGLSLKNDIGTNQLGPSSGRVKLIEFIDMECVACRRTWKMVKSLRQIYGSDLQLEIRHLPLNKACNDAAQNASNPLSCLLAYAASCSTRINRFEDFVDWAFENQWKISSEDIIEQLRKLSIERPQECIESRDSMMEVKNDVGLATALGFRGTPLFILNGRKYKGPASAAGLRRAINLLMNDTQVSQ